MTLLNNSVDAIPIAPGPAYQDRAKRLCGAKASAMVGPGRSATAESSVSQHPVRPKGVTEKDPDNLRDDTVASAF
jgi:hypothetical protein